MNDNDFWALVEKLDWTSAGDDSKVIAPLINAIAALSKGDLFKFEETLSYKLFLLDTKEHAKNIGESAYTDSDRIRSPWIPFSMPDVSWLPMAASSLTRFCMSPP